MSTNIVLTNNNYNDYLGSDFNAKVESTVFESHTGDTTVHHTLTELDGLYVDIDGDTMTGDLTMNTANIDLDNTTFANQKGIITKNNVPFIHNFNYGNNGSVTTQGQNVFIGENTGNMYMGSGATLNYHGCYNVGMGYNVLMNTTNGFSNIGIGLSTLQNVTTGSQNIGIGNSACNASSISISNIGIGKDALFTNTIGSYNIGIGQDALRSSTTGGTNISIGLESMRQFTVGHNNIAIGYGAGRYYSTGTGAFLRGDDNILLGFFTRCLANDDTNEIVIGKSTCGAGSNTATIGNTSQTLCKINGAVQVGQSSATPTAALVGAIRYRTSGNNSYCEMVMQTAASTYAWVEIKKNTW